MTDTTTPGLFYPEFKDGAWVVMSAALGVPVATIKPGLEAKANAALFAGSKEMLEMLHRCEMWLSTHPDGKAMRDAVRGTIIKVQPDKE